MMHKIPRDLAFSFLLSSMVQLLHRVLHCSGSDIFSPVFLPLHLLPAPPSFPTFLPPKLLLFESQLNVYIYIYVCVCIYI